MPYRIEYPTADEYVFEVDIVNSAVDALEFADLGGGTVYEISKEQAIALKKQLEGRT